MGADALVVIPARLHSTRLPEKVLLRQTGKYLVQHVYERALRIRNCGAVVVATDHERVRAAVESFGGQVVMTSAHHASGTDRAAEVARGRECDLVVNLQADEPEFAPEDVEALIDAMDPQTEMGTLVHRELAEAEQRDPSVVKAIVDDQGWAVDFRREPARGALLHLGIYAYQPALLQRLTEMPPSVRERRRNLEQMRAVDNGVLIRAVVAGHRGLGIDTPGDYAAFVTRYGASTS